MYIHAVGMFLLLVVTIRAGRTRTEQAAIEWLRLRALEVERRVLRPLALDGEG
jgi:hypothetical protein